ncbi:hypothetical protein Psta_0220 [Pirellula staleyi DSM 6068]|uniref:Uncharacterized protein n=1 Tax=Pirellula staleyi (strain ATCC 27377 / DSM 6068 / ICPB 4128) TaxID=530564 RepID=D2R1D1_PIRSD|nr:hypothetical protein [Pirellula staleyi]ADB14916.1 hypothetical protein Psta_0220 [Pirellula staleyi DSM 6068]
MSTAEFSGSDLSGPEPERNELPLNADALAISAEATEASQPFVGQWNHLVSTANWEKGRIIFEWREALQAKGADAVEFSDEAWSRLVGGVTGQHVGRLRRVYAKFGKTYQQYETLYWSHFQAAIDWSDAEMWLEGAMQSRWSVAQMRTRRWETLGSLATENPVAEPTITAEVDEDFEAPRAQPRTGDEITSSLGEVNSTGPLHEGPDFGDGDGSEFAGTPSNTPWNEEARGEYDEPTAAEKAQLISPFEGLPTLPDDLAEAFDQLKLAIVRHKAAGWKEVSADAVEQTLTAMKALCVAPKSSEAPF